MSGSVNSEKAEPNLTPILDMVFQLITFFMLVINFKAAALDTTFDLPVIGSARPVETKGINLLVVNINSKGEMKSNGETKKDPAGIENSIKNSGTTALMLAKKDNPNFEAGQELPTIVVIRAAQDTPFDKVYFVIQKCQENGFRSFALRAMQNPPKEKK